MMNSIKKIPISVILMFALAIGLLGFSTVGGASAVLTSFSDEYDSELTMDSIGLTLNEHQNYGAAEKVANRNYEGGGNWDSDGEPLKELLLWNKDNGALKPGASIKEGLSITNSGTIDEYVRLVVYTSWWKEVDGKLTKMQDFDASLINVSFSGDNWIEDETYTNPWTTEERKIYYYTDVLPGKDGNIVSSTEQLKLEISIDPRIKEYIETVKEETLEDGTKKITTVFAYDGATIKVEAVANGVQTHHAEDAIKSAWGRNVTITDGKLKLS